MSQNYKKESRNFTFLKIIALIILIIIAFKIAPLTANPFIFILLYVPLLLLIGFVIWYLFGDQISEPIASFILQSGEGRSKPTYYSKARALLMQNKIGDAIKVYEKI